MVSLTSMISAVLITLSTIILPFTVPAILPTFNWLLTVIAIALTTFIFVRHRENIQRIKMEQKVVFLLAYVQNKEKGCEQIMFTAFSLFYTNHILCFK